MEIDKISKLSNQLYSNLTKTGIQGIRNLFSRGKTLSEEIKYDINEEYLRQMLISQLNLDRMLLTHKYFSAVFDMRSEFNKEAEELRQRIKSGTILLFDNDTLNALFGNTLEISTPEEYENWKEFAYQDNHNGKSFDEIYYEEETKWNYENERNPIKKFIQSFKYRKMQKEIFLEDSYVKNVREKIREGINNNPEDTFNAYRECHTMLEKGVVEYEELKTVTLGKKGDPIDFKEIPKCIGKLQKRYEEIYNKNQNKEDYIKEIAKIYADFIYIQPYEDGNKRTALCLFNSMLLSKRIIPPAISLINNEQMTEAFYKVQYNDYTMLQDIIINEYRKMRPDNLTNSEVQRNEQIDFNIFDPEEKTIE